MVTVLFSWARHCNYNYSTYLHPGVKLAEGNCQRKLTLRLVGLLALDKAHKPHSLYSKQEKILIYIKLLSKLFFRVLTFVTYTGESFTNPKIDVNLTCKQLFENSIKRQHGNGMKQIVLS